MNPFELEALKNHPKERRRWMGTDRAVMRTTDTRQS
jgi:hypothetical protein